MDTPTKPGDALAQPTRARLFALLGELRRPAHTEELATRVGLHPNGVRMQLERLQDAGLVVRGRERLALGRPRDTWVISPDAQPGGDPPTGYADLGRWLVRAITAGKIRVRDVEATGRQIGKDLAPRDSDAPGDQQLHDVLAAMGFQPTREPHAGNRLTYRLGNCPYREVVRERPQVVCGLHRGIARGLLDAINPNTKLTAFVPKDPYTAGCLIELRGPLAADAAAQPPVTDQATPR
jgi:predicted ArsR family transcriptional regulator